jgi:hypothetical protein
MFFKKLYLRWVYRDQSKNALANSYLILLKSARRCAYDLRHATDNIPSEHWTYQTFKDRSSFWLEIFSPTGVKDYRLAMIGQIEKLESEVKELRKELHEHGIRSVVQSTEPF